MPIQNIMTCSESHLEQEYDYVIKQLVMYSQTIDPYESYDKYRWSEPVRNTDVDFCCRNRCDSGHHKSLWKPYKSKPKENK